MVLRLIYRPEWSLGFNEKIDWGLATIGRVKDGSVIGQFPL